MLHFNSKGLLIPATIVLSTVDELKYTFVEDMASVTRKDIFRAYLKYADELKVMLGQEKLIQWINGSFVTKKENPKDIDIVTFVDYTKVIHLENELYNFAAEEALRNFGVDAYIIEIYPEGHQKHSYYVSDLAYWKHKFGYTRRDRSGNRNKKGFLEIIY